MQESWGFNLSVGNIVSAVKKDTPAACVLLVNDELLAVADEDVTGLEHEAVVAVLQKHSTALPLTVRRSHAKGSKFARMPTLTQTAAQGVKVLRPSYGHSFGFSLGTFEDGRHFVSKVTEGGPSEGLLTVGDELLLVNGLSIAGLTHMQVLTMCCEEEKFCSLLVRRPQNAQAVISRTPSGKRALQMQVPETANADRPQRKFLQHQASVGRELKLAEEDTGQFDVELTRASTNDTFGFSIATLDSGDHVVSSVVSQLLGHKLKPLDHIIAINGTPVNDLSHEDALQMLKGITRLQLRIARNIFVQGPTRTHIKRTASGKHFDLEVKSATQTLRERAQANSATGAGTNGKPVPGTIMEEDAADGDPALAAARAAASAFSPTRGTSQALAASTYEEEIISLRAGPQGFGLELFDNGRGGVVVNNLKTESARASGLKINHELVRVRADPKDAWTDVSSMIQLAAFLKGKPQVQLLARLNPDAMRTSIKSPGRTMSSSGAAGDITPAPASTPASPAPVPASAAARPKRRGGLFSCCMRDQEQETQASDIKLRVHQPRQVRE